jgi:hypothetical protein
MVPGETWIMRRSYMAAIVATGLVLASPHDVFAQSAAGLAGDWALNRSASEFPREIGFNPDWMRSGFDTGTGRGGGGGRRGGGGGGGGSRSTPSEPVVRESADDAKRRQLLTDEVRNPPAHVTVTEADGAITITGDHSQARTFHPTGREEVLHIDDLPVATTATWISDQLVVVFNVEQGHQLRYTYSALAAPRRLRIDVQFVERGGGDSVVRMYDPAAAPTQPQSSDVPAPPSGSVPASPQPPALQPPGSELKGLSSLGVVVEDLDPQAARCGLTRGAIEAAASKALTNAGIRTATNADEDTYLYVNVMTTTMASGFCVSRYDVSLMSNTTATFSYQTKPALVQVALLHKGGVSGGGASTHAAAVLQGITQYAEQFAAQIRSANR